MLDIPTPTLRYWEQQFSIISPRRNEKGTRFYTSADIDKIRMVAYLLKDRGMHIEKAREAIRHNHSGITKRYEAIERLKSIRSQLAALLASIDSGRR